MRIRRRWRSFTSRTLSSSSRRSVPIMRSQIALARGAPGGIVKIRMSSATNTASNGLVNRESRSRIKNFTVVARSAAGDLFRGLFDFGDRGKENASSGQE